MAPQLRRALAAVLALGLGACAGTNTPQQNLAYERWAKCGSAFTRLEGIEPDGRISFLYSDSGGQQQILRCLEEAGRAGSPLPEPRWVRPPGGP